MGLYPSSRRPNPLALTVVEEVREHLGILGSGRLHAELAQQVIVTKHQGFSTVEVRGLAELEEVA